ncbi:sigma-54 interaction domain-containing protein [Desulfosporosinus nitroreducens]|uniref:Sigma 54-interacting transcriptional regulator n=1 Tax=Desulfosporosinus nitroreducens TaxID=2018668 RepID=A0ABT8QVG7_9FIRM|nr:sigma 54-interacting transcriptional regulator [Desulfosporosinus nitroreducens]MDO0824564.1 sigma 54-interacting transcriptional regulator [Desulfosporosinus nitroreducens]
MVDINENSLDREELKMILDNSFDEIFVVNNKGIVTYVNEVCKKHYGLAPSEIIGKNFNYLLNEGYYSPALAPIVFRNKQTVTVEQQTRSGIKLVVTATPVINESGEVDFIVMNSRDITQIEQLKQDLDETKKLVKHYKNKVDELSQQVSYFKGYSFRDEKMKLCLEVVQRVALVNSTVLILGESGTGKNVLAMDIHKISDRKDGPFICINGATIPEHLLESELFGYCRGAFTGADKYGKVGLVELANGGTLFLDEIGEIPLGIQAKLLELIQEHRFIPVGGKEHKKIDIRIIAATNRNLVQLIEEGKFREDLYYRLSVIEIDTPPLRDRSEDIIPLLQFFISKYDLMYKYSHKFDKQTLTILKNYSWPGNIREMEHLAERLVVTIPEGNILPEHLPSKIFKIPSVPLNANMLQDELSNWKNLKKSSDEEAIIIRLYNMLGSSYKVATTLNISQSKVTRIVRNYKQSCTTSQET